MFEKVINFTNDALYSYILIILLVLGGVYFTIRTRFAQCVSRGLFITSHHNHFINAALTREDIALAVDIAEDAFSVVAAQHPELGL